MHFIRKKLKCIDVHPKLLQIERRNCTVGCLTSHSTQVISGTIKPVIRRDQAQIPPEPLNQ